MGEKVNIVCIFAGDIKKPQVAVAVDKSKGDLWFRQYDGEGLSNPRHGYAEKEQQFIVVYPQRCWWPIILGGPSLVARQACQGLC